MSIVKLQRFEWGVELQNYTGQCQRSYRTIWTDLNWAVMCRKLNLGPNGLRALWAFGRWFSGNSVVLWPASFPFYRCQIFIGPPQVLRIVRTTQELFFNCMRVGILPDKRPKWNRGVPIFRIFFFFFVLVWKW